MLQSLCFAGALLVGLSSPRQDLEALTAGVAKVAKPGLPGVVSAIASDAVPFLIANDGKVLIPVATAGRLGKGRVAAFGHGGYLSQASANEGDTGKLLANVIRWCSRRAGQVRVGYVQPEDREWVANLGFEALTISRSNLPDDLRRVDVAIIPANWESSAIETYVKNGGGLITAHTPWGWMQLNPGKDLATEMPMQHLLHQAGLSFSDGTADRVWPAKSLEESNRTNALLALQALDADSQQAASAIMAALRSTTEREAFNKQVRSAISGAPAKIPSAATPLESKDALARLALAVRWLDRQAGKSSARKEPSADDFPGAVPADAARVDADLRLPLDKRQWVSTGLYAAAGEEIHVEGPTNSSGLSIQIGCHTDGLWQLDKWQRHPEITVRKALEQGSAKITSPFGGLIYIVVDRPQPGPDQKFAFTNVVRSARFVLGKTSRAEWQSQLKLQAPWAEIGSGKIIFSVPIEAARQVDDPDALMQLWDKTIDLYCELDGSPVFDRPERIVCDRQISAGYMHSGYPIMTWMDKSVPLSLSVQELTTSGTWGHWHELGHNRQKDSWTFGGTGEVTNNIFTLYMMEKIAGKSIWDRIGAQKPKVDAYLAKGGDFNEWQSEPFLALYMYGLLIRDFGWDSMKKYFRSYMGPDAGPMPKSDLEKRDQFMTRYSRVIGRNLAPYFQAWAVPTSEAARDSIKGLPAWMPKDFPGR